MPTVMEQCDKDQLQRLYVTEYKTVQEIGDMFGVSNQRIHQLLKKHGLGRVCQTCGKPLPKKCRLFCCEGCRPVNNIRCRVCGGKVSRKTKSSVCISCSILSHYATAIELMKRDSGTTALEIMDTLGYPYRSYVQFMERALTKRFPNHFSVVRGGAGRLAKNEYRTNVYYWHE